MKYCFAKSDLLNLLSRKTKQNLIKLSRNKPEGLSLSEMLQKDAKKFASKTLTAEIFTAINLSDLYFGPETQTNICFDMKTNFDKNLLKNGKLSYEDLEKWIESYTSVDCYISNKLKEHRFQIKRYPEPWRIIHTNDVLMFIKETSKSYGNMLDTTLVLILQPEKPYEYQDIDWIALARDLAFLDIRFKEIVFMLNVVGKGISLCTVYPDYNFKSL